jgi:hypothetical protein
MIERDIVDVTGAVVDDIAPVVATVSSSRITFIRAAINAPLRCFKGTSSETA